MATRASRTVGAVEHDHRGRADDGDLHLAAVLQADVRAPRPSCGRGYVDRDEELVVVRGGGAGAGEELGDGDRARPARGPERDGRVEAHQRAARLHRRRRVHQVAAERPVRTRRVGADDRAGVRERREALDDRGVGGDLGVARQRAEAQAAVGLRDPGQLGDAVDRDERSGSGALPCRAPTTRSVPPATGRAPSASAESASSTVVAVAKLTRSPRAPRPARASSAARARALRGPSRSRSRSRPRWGRTAARRRPWSPWVPRSGVSVSIHATSIGGASEAVTSL